MAFSGSLLFTRHLSAMRSVPPVARDSGLFNIDLPAFPKGDDRLELLEGLEMLEDLDRQSAIDSSMSLLDVGGSVWPCAAILCTWLRSNQQLVRGASVLELGSGTGACGLYAAGLGASRVLLTDGSEGLLQLIAANRERNERLLLNSSVAIAHLQWNDVPPPAGPWDLVIGSDLTYGYEPGVHVALAATLIELLRGVGSPPRVLLAHQHRDRKPSEAVMCWDDRDETIRRFSEAAAAVGLAVEQVLSHMPAPNSEAREISIIEVRLAS